MQYLKCCGYVDDFRPYIPAYQTLLNEYLEWMKRYRNTALATLKLRTRHLMRFFDWLDSDSPLEKLPTLSPDEIQTFFLNYCKARGRASRRSMQSALRTFLRFCFVRGYVKQELDRVVPTLRTYKLSKLPRGIEHKEGQRLLATIDRSTDAGRRDYAILQLLYTYGIRGGQVRALQLDDINWEQSQIRFLALKNGKDSLLPLTEDVGNSLLDYLQYSRPQVPYPEVFITLRAPYGPLRHSTCLCEIVARRMRKANIKSPTYGTHTFRHCFASRMLQKGHSLKFIADMIGHRCLQTTFIYTKVDFKKLKDVALQWPGQGR
jgi:site-specific recombinase XerD